MNRRDFFKFPAVIALMTAVPPLAKVAPAASVPLTVPIIPIAAGLIREVMGYDINRDCLRLQWDLSDGMNQYSVHQVFNYEDSEKLEREEYLIRLRESSIAYLQDYAVSKGMDLKKLVRLELPQGVNHARYV